MTRRTNGDRIRFFRALLDVDAEPDEVIARENVCPYDKADTCQLNLECYECRLGWLKQESEEYDER